MIPSEIDKLYQVVPIGEENALSASAIRRNLGLWSNNAIRVNLNRLAENGFIYRKMISEKRSDVNVYYRHD